MAFTWTPSHSRPPNLAQSAGSKEQLALGAFGEDLNTYDLSFQHRGLLARRHNVIWGLSYRLADDNVDNSTVLAFLPAHLNRQIFSTFVQDRILLIEDRLSLTLGSKFEHNDYTGFEYQPNIRMAWTPTGRVRPPHS